MNIDFSKITQEELDAVIKEEALKIRAELLSEKKKEAKLGQLAEQKRKLEKELALLESESVDEGLFGSLFGKGDGDAKRKQTVLNILGHPHKSVELLTYASPAQIEQFKSYMPKGKEDFIDFVIKRKIGAKKQEDERRAESYVQFFQNGGKSLRWDPAKHEYIDAGQVAGSASTAFAEGEAV